MLTTIFNVILAFVLILACFPLAVILAGLFKITINVWQGFRHPDRWDDPEHPPTLALAITTTVFSSAVYVATAFLLVLFI